LRGGCYSDTGACNGVRSHRVVEASTIDEKGSMSQATILKTDRLVRLWRQR